MSQTYYFGINEERVGPLSEAAIRDRIADGAITRTTLAWCESMDDWRPVAEITELMRTVGDLLAEPASPPPLPARSSAPASSAPPLSQAARPEAPATAGADSAGNDLDPSYQVPEGLGSLGAAAYHVVFWLFRPWRGRPSLVRKFVRENPKRAVPVAAVTLAGLLLLFCVALAPIMGAMDEGTPWGQQQQVPATSGGGGRNPYQPMIQAQHDISDMIDDSYRYQRDSFDQQCETYRRANYDWYNDND
jgi:hypothetical protein